MGTTRFVSRSLVAAIGLIALTVFGVLPAEGFGSQEVQAGPIVGPELPVSYPVPGTPHNGEQPAVAFGGSVYLTAWSEFPRGVVVARVDRAGTVIEGSGTPLTGGALGESPAVAFDGVNFLVVWGGGGVIFAKRVSPGGVVLDEATIRISSGAAVAFEPTVAFDGTNYFVIWSVHGDGGIYGTHVSPSGVVLEPADLPIVIPGTQSDVDLAFNGTHHLVVWAKSSGAGLDVYGTLVTTSGTVLNPSGFPVSAAAGTQARAAAAALGTSFVVVWEDQRAGEIPDVYGARVDATGRVLDPSGIAISATTEHEASPNVVSDGTNALVTFGVARPGSFRTVGARVDPSGTVLDPSGVVMPVPGIESALTFDGDNFFVAGWDPEGILARRTPIRGARVTRRLAVLDPAGITISIGANSQSSLDMAFDGTNHLVVWSDDRSHGEGPGLYGARVGPDGQVLDGTGFLIATRGDGSNPRNPSVAFDGTTFLVTWLSDFGVSAARVSGAGVVLDRFAVTDPSVAGQRSAPVVAFGGGGFLVTWIVSTSAGDGFAHEIRAARVSTNGEVLDPSGFQVSIYSTALPPSTLDVAFGGTNFVVVWAAPGFDGQFIYGARVMTQGPGPVPVPARFLVSSAARWQTDPSIAWNGVTHLVVWASSPDQSENAVDIYGARVDDAGAVLDPAGIAISTATGDQQTPTVAANGPFLVTWTDRRRDLETTTDLFATRVDADGTVVHPEGFAVATSLRNYPLVRDPVPVATAATGAGNFTVGYERFVLDPPYDSSRAFVRNVSPK